MPKRRKTSARAKHVEVSDSSADETFTATQTQRFNHLSTDPKTLKHLLVRYLVYRAGDKCIILRSDLVKVVKMKSGFSALLPEVITRLQTVYGYDLVPTDEKARAYIIVNMLPHKDDINSPDAPKDAKKVILLLLLAHVRMSRDSASESNVKEFLRRLKIDVEAKQDDTIGNFKEYMKTLVRTGYLTVGKDDVGNENLYGSGKRATAELKSPDLLEFVCKIYGSRVPESLLFVI